MFLEHCYLDCLGAGRESHDSALHEPGAGDRATILVVVPANELHDTLPYGEPSFALGFVEVYGIAPTLLSNPQKTTRTARPGGGRLSAFASSYGSDVSNHKRSGPRQSTKKCRN